VGALLAEARGLLPEVGALCQLRAELALAQGQVDESLAERRKAWELEPVPAHLEELAAAQLDAGRDADALATLGQAAPMVAASAELLCLRARVEARLKQKDAAAASLLAAIGRLRPGAAQWLEVANRAGADLTPEQAAALPRQALDAGVTAEALDRFVAQLYRLQKPLARREAWLTALERELGGTALGLSVSGLRALHLREAGAVEPARALYAEGLKEQPSNPVLLSGLALLNLEDLNQPHDAMNYANRAVEAAGESGRVAADCLDTLAQTQMKLGFHAQAKITLRRSVRAAGTPSNHLHLAQATVAEGDRRTARNHFEEARRLALWEGRDDLLPVIEAGLARLPADPAAAPTP